MTLPFSPVSTSFSSLLKIQHAGGVFLFVSVFFSASGSLFLIHFFILNSNFYPNPLISEYLSRDKALSLSVFFLIHCPLPTDSLNLGVPLTGRSSSGLSLSRPGIFCPAVEEPPGSENTATMHCRYG
jgi:hypothetical protein